MIDITIKDKNNKDIASCGASLSDEKEIKIYFALRNALLDYNKLISIFGGN